VTPRCSCCYKFYRAYPEDPYGDICADCLEWCDECDQPQHDGLCPVVVA